MILVGDMHAVQDELDECAAVVNLAREKARETGDRTIVFLGDQTDGHDILRLRVMDFWRQQTRNMVHDGNEVIYMVGNHDMHVSGVGASAMEFLRGIYDVDMLSLKATGPRIVDKPMAIDGFIFMPFVRDQAEFLRLAQENSGPSFKVLICHQTFNGAMYDNGFPAHDGIDLDSVPFERIISGHIHTPMTIGKLTYIGSPRWRTANDANVEKAIVQLNAAGDITQRFDTSVCCRKIVSMDVYQDTVVPEFPPNADVRLALRGPREWVKEKAPALEAKGYAVARIPDAIAAPRVSESAPVAESFKAFVAGFKTPNSTPADKLLNIAAKYL